VTERLFTDTTSTASSARIVPNTVAGKPHGFKLFGIRPSVWLAQLGLVNGDLVLSLNGQDVGTPEAMLATYAQLRNATELTVALERAGKPFRRELHFDRRPLKPGECPPLDPTNPTPASAPTAVTPPPESPHVTQRDLAKDILCKGTRCILRNGVVDHVVANNDLIIRSGRFVPVMKDGQVVGFKVFAVRPGSLLALLGLKNGDLVRTINDRSLASPQEALETYASLRTATEFRVVLDRAGKPVTTTYVIQR
jgi:type II secretory pathway component PulC